MSEKLEKQDLKQELAERLNDQRRMDYNEWTGWLERIAYKIPNEKSPDYDYKLWEEFLRRGIEDLSHALTDKDLRKIVKDKNFEPENRNLTNRALNYFHTTTAPFWYWDIERQLQHDAHTNPETILALAQELINKAGIKIVKLLKDLKSGKQTIKYFIDGPVRRIEQALDRQRYEESQNALRRMQETWREDIKVHPDDYRVTVTLDGVSVYKIGVEPFKELSDKEYIDRVATRVKKILDGIQ